VPGFLQTRNLLMRFIRPDKLVFHSLKESFRNGFANSKRVFMLSTEERFESGHSAIKPRSLECCSDVCSLF